MVYELAAIGCVDTAGDSVLKALLLFKQPQDGLLDELFSLCATFAGKQRQVCFLLGS